MELVLTVIALNTEKVNNTKQNTYFGRNRIEEENHPAVIHKKWKTKITRKIKTTKKRSRESLKSHGFIGVPMFGEVEGTSQPMGGKTAKHKDQASQLMVWWSLWCHTQTNELPPPASPSKLARLINSVGEPTQVSSLLTVFGVQRTRPKCFQ